MKDEQSKGVNTRELVEKLEELTIRIEKMNGAEQMRLWDRPVRMIWMNLLYGIARGLGIAIGATLLGALLVFILGKLVNLPLIGSYVAELVRIVQVQLGYY